VINREYFLTGGFRLIAYQVDTNIAASSLNPQEVIAKKQLQQAKWVVFNNYY
jgi:hypothetical protein